MSIDTSQVYRDGWQADGSWQCEGCRTALGRNLNGAMPFAQARAHVDECSFPLFLPYTLTLTPDEVDTIAFVGDRYSWSHALRHCEAGINGFAEHEAWELAAAFEADAEGGHDHFPLLDPTSSLAAKLVEFLGEIV